MGPRVRFDSIPRAAWFVAEVISTVGLGEVYPRTVMGKIITGPLMMIGLVALALPSIVISRHFAEAWTWLKRAHAAPEDESPEERGDLVASLVLEVRRNNELLAQLLAKRP